MARPKGLAYVTFSSEAERTAAMEFIAQNEPELHGRKLAASKYLSNRGREVLGVRKPVLSASLQSASTKRASEASFLTVCRRIWTRSSCSRRCASSARYVAFSFGAVSLSRVTRCCARGPGEAGRPLPRLKRRLCDVRGCGVCVAPCAGSLAHEHLVLL